MLSALDISTSGLVAQRMRMIQISNNIANIKSTHTSSGEKVPYQPKTRRLRDRGGGRATAAAGVKVSSVQTLPTEPIWRSGAEPSRRHARPARTPARWPIRTST